MAISVFLCNQGGVGVKADYLNKDLLCNQGIFLKKGLHNERLSRLLSQSSKNCVTSKKIQRLKLHFYYSDRKKENIIRQIYL